MTGRTPPAGGYKLVEVTPPPTRRPVGAAVSTQQEGASPPLHARARGRARAADAVSPSSSAASSIVSAASLRSPSGPIGSSATPPQSIISQLPVVPPRIKPPLKRERSGSIPHNFTISSLSHSIPPSIASPPISMTMAGSLSPRADIPGYTPPPLSDEKNLLGPEDRAVARTNSVTKPGSIDRTSSSSAEEGELARLVCSDTESGIAGRLSIFSRGPAEKAIPHTNSVLFPTIHPQPILIHSAKDLQRAFRESQVAARVDYTISRKVEPSNCCARFCKKNKEQAHPLIYQLATLALTPTGVATSWVDRLTFLINLYDKLAVLDHKQQLIEAVHQHSLEHKQLNGLLDLLKGVRRSQLFLGVHPGFVERLIVRQLRLPPKSASACESWRRGDEGKAWRSGTVLFVRNLSLTLESAQHQELVRQVENEFCAEIRDLILNLICIELDQVKINNQLLELFRGNQHLAATLLRGYFDVRLNAMYGDLIVVIDKWRRGSPPPEGGERESQEVLLRSLLDCVHERKRYTAVVEMLRSLRELLQIKVAQWNDQPDDQKRIVAAFLHSFLCLRSINLMLFDRLGFQDPITPKLARAFQLLGDPEPRTPRDDEDSWVHASYNFGKSYYSSHRNWLLDLSEREEELPPEPDQAPE